MGETIIDFEEKMKELVTKGVEKAIEKSLEAVRQSLVEWAIERQTTATKHHEAPFNTKRDEHITLQAGMTSTLTELKLTCADKVEGSAN